MRRILVPLTEGAADPETLRAIMDVAWIGGSTIRLLYIRPLASEAPLNDDGARQTGGIAVSLGGISVERVIRFGDVETAILKEAAAWRADVIALSAGDRMWLSRAVRTGRAARAFPTNGIPALLYTPSPC